MKERSARRYPESAKEPRRPKAIDKIAEHLARRDHSAHELELKLKKKYTPEEIHQALTEATRRRWLIEPTLLAKKIADQLRRRKKSHRYVQATLKRMKLPGVEMVSDTEFESARELISRRFPRAQLSWDDKKRAHRYLSYRGFSGPVISRVLKFSSESE